MLVRKQTDQTTKNDHPTDATLDPKELTDYLSQDRNSSSSRNVQEVASSALIDSLANEWWSANLSQTVINDLLENLVPLVVLACEQVLNEADERHLVETTTPDRSFNPINRLASFLMRNNPKYMQYSSLSPYHYTMKSLLNTKRIQVLKVYGEEETLLRSVLKGRQNERHQQETSIKNEEERRKGLLKTLFHDWNVPERGWLQTKLVNNMLEQFKEMPKPGDLQPKLSTFQNHRMHLGTFTDNFLQGLSTFSSDHFNSIVHLYRLCAQTYSKIVQEHDLDHLLQRLFNQLDDKHSGYLLRNHVLQTLQKFYDALSDQDKQSVTPANQWPVVQFTTSWTHSVSATPDPTMEQTDSSAANEQPAAAPVPSADGENKDGDQGDDDREKKPTIQLKNPTAYESNFRYVNEQKPVYNLEHFETTTHQKSMPSDERLVDKLQFSSLLISFVGVKKNEMIICALIDFFRSNYRETPEEKNEKKNLLQQRQIDAQRRISTDLLFEKMNTTCTRLVKIEPLAIFLKQYKEGTLIEQIEQFLQKYPDGIKLNSSQFYRFLLDFHQTLNEYLGGNEKFDDLVKFIENQFPQLSTADRTRAHTRHQWLKRLRQISHRDAGHLYKEVMDIIQKDSDTFANQSPPKTLSIYIALMDDDPNQVRYVATTNDQTDVLLGKTLKREQGISFQVLDSGKWAYINQTKNHTRLYFFNPTMKHQSGSFVLMPLKNLHSTHSVGLLGLDTIRDKKDKAFVQHEIQFYEGIASTIAETLTVMNFHQNVMKMIDRFIYWAKQRCSQVSTIDYYTYEPNSTNNPNERVLKHVLHYADGNATVFDRPKTINSRDQVFKYYLTHAAITGQSRIAAFLGQTHLIQTMCGKDKFCFGLIDTNIGEQEDLPNEQKKDLLAMYRCISTAIDRLEQEPTEDQSKGALDSEKRSKYLFDHLWFLDVCHQIRKISGEKIEEFIQQKSKWNDQTKQIVSSISQLVKKKEINAADYESVLIPAMIDFDPTTKESLSSDQWNRVAQVLQNSTSSKQDSTTEITKLFSDWLTIAHELYRISK